MTIHIAAAAFVRSGRVLLGHRRPDREAYPSCWDLIGGHVEPGEDPVAALRRECREEIGVVIEVFAPFDVGASDPALTMHSFLVTRWHGEPSNTAPDEHDDLRWFTADEIGDLVLTAESSRIPLQRAARGVESGW